MSRVDRWVYTALTAAFGLTVAGIVALRWIKTPLPDTAWLVREDIQR